MRRWKNWVCALMLVLVTIAVCACGTEEKSASLEGYEQNNQALAFDNSKWNYDADNDVYWQVKVSYCSEPVWIMQTLPMNGIWANIRRKALARKTPGLRPFHKIWRKAMLRISMTCSLPMKRERF
ncbi:hypothetical protein [Hominibacterium faecale]|uniref:hypothetical protein n=1 Tax=Hominibacterium faecale TaxID=2839743 RepID=UPI0022B29FCE|nr:hypothetical protein [Hominibacterium faecale]